MQAEDLIKLVEKIRKYNCEFQTIEVKAANMGCPTRLFDTLSSFSNQDEGGVIVFGLDEKTDFSVVGVYDAQDLQKKVMEQCKQMQPKVRALFTVCDIEGKLIVSAEIPAVDISERPVYYAGVGRIKGSYIRVGDSDEIMSEYEIYSYEAFRKRIQDDLRPTNRANLKMLNEDRINKYLAEVKRERKNLAFNVSDEDILELMGVMNNGVPTLAGEMCFSIYPQGSFPQLCVTAVAIPGTQIGELGKQGERFTDNERITGTIEQMVDETVEFVRRNGKMKTIVNDDGKREDRAEYPPKAVREAILNALVHRDYSIHTENVPVRVEMYHDRLEIKSSGGLYGRISIDVLGKVRPETRNAALANILEVLKVTENRYSGIPTIQAEMEKYGLPKAVFKVERGEFITTFYSNNVSIEDDLENTKKININKLKLLNYCSVPRSRDEIVSYMGFSRYYTCSVIMKSLIESKQLKLTIPDKPQSKNQKYYSEI